MKNTKVNSRLDFLIKRRIAKSKRSQVTVFIILAIIIVAGIVAFFVLRNRGTISEFSATYKPVEQQFLSCLQDRLDEGKNLLESTGGYIYQPDFIAGSDYAPFSNKLDFQGIGVPYWYYLSSNNFIREQVPSRTSMEEQLGRFVKENFKCDFSEYQQQGYFIEIDFKQAKAKISDLSINLDVNADLVIGKDESREKKTSHRTSIDTRLGRFYNTAVKIYNKEKKESFLENYAVDVLRLYAPVDGVEITCSPKTWIPERVSSDLKDGLEANIQAIKTGSRAIDKYFSLSIETDVDVNFLYSRNWPSRIEIWPSEGVMSAEPVGNQEGMGILGFCYVPYHFVYDVLFPVMVQVYDTKEMFQFPVAVIIDKNKARESLEGEATPEREFDLCAEKNTQLAVYTYDKNLEPVEADLTFTCMQQSCNIGKTKTVAGKAFLLQKFPQCVNGFVIARAAGYSEKKFQVSSNTQGIVDIILDKLYDISIDVKVNGKVPDGNSLVYFKSDDYSSAVSWPEQKSVQLKEGFYNITLYVYANSSLKFPASTSRKCVPIQSPGIFGFFSKTSEQCFDVNTPEQQITSVLFAGGKTQEYISDQITSLELSSESFPSVTTIEDVGKNYDLFETKSINVVAR